MRSHFIAAAVLALASAGQAQAQSEYTASFELDGSLFVDRRGYEITPDKVDLPYGIKLVHGDRPIRKITLEKSEHKAKDDGGPAHIDNFFACLKSREKPVADIEVPTLGG